MQGEGIVERIDFSTPEGREVFRHSASHIMAQAVKRLYPEAKLGIGPAIEDGFYYDFDLPRTLSEEDLPEIEKEMQKIIEEDLPFVREELPKEEARKLFESLGEKYKVELIDEIEDEVVSIYRNGEFVDLCRGPHLPSTGYVKAFKLLSVAGAYWRGDERNPMLQRIYGTAFPTREELEDYLARLEEAKKRDHRKLGVQLDLYSIRDEVGPGLVLWHPKGATVRRIIEDFWREEHIKRGYQIIYTPHIARINLWEKSGHLAHFADMMYSPMEVEGQKYLLKPMNCPFHIQIYKSSLRSYKELPIRYAELGTVYRYERSGVLHGLLRVRGFTQDDAHIFCMPEQIYDEVLGVIDLAEYMIRTFGYEDFLIELSVRDPENKEKYLGEDEGWERAESILAQALEKKGLPYKIMEGEAKFYGPAIDIKLKDSLGRAWQGPTIQFDFNLPRRLDVTYIGPDGKEHFVTMIHRTVLGTMERFIGGLVEHYGGAFPPWLAPVQVVVMNITDAQADYAREVAERLREEGLRVELDLRGDKINSKIRDAQLQKIPYMIIVGEKEKNNRTLALRKRTGEQEYGVKIEEFINEIKQRIKDKSLKI